MDIVWSLEIEKYKPNRTKAQNRLLWKWLEIIGNDLGYTKKEMHAIMASKFLGIETICGLNETIEQPMSTSKLKVKEFSEYLGQIERFSNGELGIFLPNSDDLYFEAMGIKRKQ